MRQIASFQSLEFKPVFLKTSTPRSLSRIRLRRSFHRCRKARSGPSVLTIACPFPKLAPCLAGRCHTGHAFSIQTLLSQLNAQTEANLWTAVRGMEETVLLLDHFAKHLNES